MTDVEGVFTVVEKLVGTPLYLLMSVGCIVFFVYYFAKVAPARYKAFENLIKDNTKQTISLEKLSEKYDKALENSNRVIENNTAALKSTQSMLELCNAKIDANTKKVQEVDMSAKDFNDKMDDLHVTIAKIDVKVEKLIK